MNFLTLFAFILNVIAGCVCGSWLTEDYMQTGRINKIALVFTILNAFCAIYNFIVLINIEP